MFGKTYIKRATSFDDMTHTSQSLSEVGQKKKKKPHKTWWKGYYDWGVDG